MKNTLLSLLAFVLLCIAMGVAYGINAGLLGPDTASLGLLAMAGVFSALEYRKEPNKE